jgi:hypothetical protein
MTRLPWSPSSLPWGTQHGPSSPGQRSGPSSSPR